MTFLAYRLKDCAYKSNKIISSDMLVDNLHLDILD